MTTQTYKYQGEEFAITKPEACGMKISRGEYTAIILIHPATNRFRESLRRLGQRSCLPSTGLGCRVPTNFGEGG